MAVNKWRKVSATQWRLPAREGFYLVEAVAGDSQRFKCILVAPNARGELTRFCLNPGVTGVRAAKRVCVEARGEKKVGQSAA